MTLTRATSATIACLLVWVLVSCGQSSHGSRGAIVFAAASLTGAFQELGRQFERAHPDHGIELHFAGTPQLVMQLREGAPADVFAAADVTSMQRVVASGRTVGEPVTFASNHMTIVVPKGNAQNIRGLVDLARTDLRVVLCGPEVPAGRYARQVLERAGVTVRSVSDEPSVKAVVSKVAMGEVDAGIVYVTDTVGAPRQIETVPIDPACDVVAHYPIVLIGGGGGQPAGAAFLAFVESAEGRAILRQFGFGAP